MVLNSPTTALLVVAFVIEAAAPAMAGPWCSENTDGWAPAEGAHLPPRAHLRFVYADVYYAGKRHPGSRAFGEGPVRATLDGKPIKLAVRTIDTGVVMFRDIAVGSDKPGALVVEVGEPGDAYIGHYTIDAAWKAPASVAAVAISRYVHHVLFERPTTVPDSGLRGGAAIELDAPVIAVTGRWRRDAQDAWRTLQLAAMPVHDTPGHAIVEVGETKCRAATVPLSLLEHGVELELVARLPNGKTFAVDGLPKPFVLAPP
jgi:hypothetical protein